MELIVVGANSLGQYIAKNYSQFGLPCKILGYVDDRVELRGKSQEGLPVLGPVEEILST